MKLSSRSTSRTVGGGLRAASFASYAVLAFRSVLMVEKGLDQRGRGSHALHMQESFRMGGQQRRQLFRTEVLRRMSIFDL